MKVHNSERSNILMIMQVPCQPSNHKGCRNIIATVIFVLMNNEYRFINLPNPSADNQ